ncbi:MAG: twin-arginine translocase TatA/TatE family subunit [Rudaea sp.]
MDFFGVGPAELALIMVIVLVVFGPDQLPEIAKKLGHATRDIRRSINDMGGEVNESLKPFQELKDIANTVKNPTSLLTAPPEESKPDLDANLIVADEAQAPTVATPESEPTTPVDTSPQPSAAPTAEPPKSDQSDDWSV